MWSRLGESGATSAGSGSMPDTVPNSASRGQMNPSPQPMSRIFARPSRRGRNSRSTRTTFASRDRHHQWFRYTSP
jgi:hypothetical protein